MGRLLVAGSAEAQPEGAEGFYGAPRLSRVRDYSRDGVLASLEASLTRLGTGPDRHRAHPRPGRSRRGRRSTARYPALAELRAAGVLGAIGVGMNQAPVLEWFVRRADLDCVLDGRALLPAGRPGCGPHCSRPASARGVAVLAGGIFNSGLLV